MIRKILGVVIGLPLGVVCVSLMHKLEHSIYEVPEKVSSGDMEAIAEYIQTMSLGQFAMVWLAHGSGAFVSAAICTAIAGSRWYVGAGICGCMFLLAGFLNVVLLPHPLWFAVVDLLLYIPLALASCYLVGSLFQNAEQASADKKPADEVASN